jgi:predicted regulator of Ras-like GTPase activity (Roadblock/LC7/MglB family)
LTSVQDLVRALREVAKAEAVALINRDGSVLATDLPRGIPHETFSIMCAAIMGAGMTAATELRHSPPHRVILESKDATFVISEVGRRAMVIVAIPPERPVSELIAAVERFAQAATRLLG